MVLRNKVNSYEKLVEVKSDVESDEGVEQPRSGDGVVAVNSGSEKEDESYINLVDETSESEDEEVQKSEKYNRKRALESDESDEIVEKEQIVENDHKKAKTESDGGGLASNEDFIGFDFADSEDEAESSEEEQAVATNNEGKPSVHKNYPWILNHDHSTQREIADWLSLEINDFVSYISPSKEEIITRNECITRLKTAIEAFWKDSHVYVFGSYATDLYLPHSDIDMVVKTDDDTSGNLKDNRNSLYKLSAYLKNKKIVTNVEVLAKARVPIIKLVETRSKINIDISFERSNGIEAAMVIKNWLNTTPALRELVLIVKHFLSTRNLNNVHLGGLGGYSTICLVYTFLKLHPRLVTNSMDPMKNIGVLLIEFFELFGKNFGYDNVAVAPVCPDNNGLPGFLNKNHYADLQNRNPFQLAIQDPSDPTNNISRGSFNVRGLKKAFTGAFDLLVDKCFELEKKSYKERINESILGNIVKYKGEPRDFVDERNLVENVAAIEQQVFYYKQDQRKPLVSDKETLFLSDDGTIQSNSESSENSESESDSEVELKKPNTIQNGISVDQIMGLLESDDDNYYIPDPASDNEPQITQQSSQSDVKVNSNDPPQEQTEKNNNNENQTWNQDAKNFKKTKRDFWKQKGTVDLSY